MGFEVVRLSVGLLYLECCSLPGGQGSDRRIIGSMVGNGDFRIRIASIAHIITVYSTPSPQALLALAACLHLNFEGTP